MNILSKITKLEKNFIEISNYINIQTTTNTELKILFDTQNKNIKLLNNQILNKPNLKKIITTLNIFKHIKKIKIQEKFISGEY